MSEASKSDADAGTSPAFPSGTSSAATSPSYSPLHAQGARSELQKILLLSARALAGASLMLRPLVPPPPPPPPPPPLPAPPPPKAAAMTGTATSTVLSPSPFQTASALLAASAPSSSSETAIIPYAPRADASSALSSSSPSSSSSPPSEAPIAPLCAFPYTGTAPPVVRQLLDVLISLAAAAVRALHATEAAARRRARSRRAAKDSHVLAGAAVGAEGATVAAACASAGTAAAVDAESKAAAEVTGGGHGVHAALLLQLGAALLHHGLLRPSRPLLVGAGAGAEAAGASAAMGAGVRAGESGRAAGWRILRALCGLSEEGEAAETEAESESESESESGSGSGSDDDGGGGNAYGGSGDGNGGDGVGGTGAGSALPLSAARARSLLRSHVVSAVEAQSRAQAQEQAGAGPAGDTEEADDVSDADIGSGLDAAARSPRSRSRLFPPSFRPGHAANAPALRYLALPVFEPSSQVRRESEAAADVRASEAHLSHLIPRVPRRLFLAHRAASLPPTRRRVSAAGRGFCFRCSQLSPRSRSRVLLAPCPRRLWPRRRLARMRRLQPCRVSARLAPCLRAQSARRAREQSARARASVRAACPRARTGASAVPAATVLSLPWRRSGFRATPRFCSVRALNARRLVCTRAHAAKTARSDPLLPPK